MRSRLTQVFSRAFEAQGFEARWGEVTVSDRPDLAHYQCNGALPAAKKAGKNPREVAGAIQSAVQAELGPEDYELSIAGPGFVNVRIRDGRLAREIEAVRGDHARMGVEKVAPAGTGPGGDGRPRKVVVDFGAPNVAKPMHVGHLRSSIIGDSIVRVLRFFGDEVIGDNHIGDWGTPMGMILCELRREQPELPYFRSDYAERADVTARGDRSPVTMEDLERLYPVAAKRFKEDEGFAAEVLRATDELQKGRVGYKALWKHFFDTTIRAMERDFASLGIRFDVWLGESFYEEKMPPLVERLKKAGTAVLSEGAWVIPLDPEKPGGPEVPPLILVKSGGGFLYGTSDLATIEHRVREFGAGLAVYVVDKRQSLHFKQVFAGARKAGICPPEVELVHAGFGTMNGKDGKPFKTREGGVLKLGDLIAMVLAEARKRLDEMEALRSAAVGEGGRGGGGDNGSVPAYGAEEGEEIARKVGMATLKYADLKNNRTVDYVFDLEKFSRFEGDTGPYLLYAAVRIKSILRKAQEAEAGLAPGPIVAPREGPLGEPERKLCLELLKLPEALMRAYQNYEPHHLCDYGFALSQAFNHFYKECHILREPDSARRASWLALSEITHDALVLCLGLLGISVPDRM